MSTPPEQRPPRKKCPIPGCNHVYERGITGYFAHVKVPSNHPNYFPEVDDYHARETLFREDFPEFFKTDPKIAEPRRPPSSPNRRAIQIPLMQVAARPKRGRLPPVRCPLRGCKHVFADGLLGWEEHVGNWDKHPEYHPEVPSPKLRAAMFKNEFVGWFYQSDEGEPRDPSPANGTP